jgi:hypothetical protein
VALGAGAWPLQFWGQGSGIAGRASVRREPSERPGSGYLINRTCLAVLGELPLGDGDLEAASAYDADVTCRDGSADHVRPTGAASAVGGLPRLALA